MKKETNKPVALTESEINYVYTCWKQAYSDAYKEFLDYLNVAIRKKEICGTVYA